MFKLFVCFVAITATVSCFPTTTNNEEAIDKPGYCRIDDVYIKEGEEGPGPIGQCVRIKCHSAEPGRVGISGLGCGTFAPRKGCSRTGYDNTKRYPACCPQEKCPVEEGNNNL
ncbi:hypothetical protein ILUMI_05978 [Ignelater luminosus]|uniref:Single domain-containing protein n=1 Tax=Ignelater luminosus TaxID=2038154 RepID=A0A8K0GJK8_IGNLU|nr:hypothetical protein ILUMI_05978 [Ignelater luminosus]